MGRFFKYRRNDVSNCCNQVKCHWLSKAEVSPRTLTIAKLNKAGTSHIAALTGFAGAGGADARAQSSEGVKRAQNTACCNSHQGLKTGAERSFEDGLVRLSGDGLGGFQLKFNNLTHTVCTVCAT